jgi:DNA-directed RNA polymerase I, II, and III subunit RPABC1
MDTARILKHSVELLQLRGEDTDIFEKELAAIKPHRFSNQVIPLSTANITVFYILSRDKGFKDLWGAIRGEKSLGEKSIEETLKRLEGTYNNTRKFIMIMHELPSPITLQAVQNMNTEMIPHKGFIQIFLVKELMYNPTKHGLVPKHEKLNKDEEKALIESLQLKSKVQLPFIQRTDVMARWLGLQHGDIVRITRYSETSGEYYFYRCCL